MKKFLFCVLCVFLSVVLFACSSSQTQFSAQEKENIIKCADAILEYNTANYDDEALNDVYNAYLNLDYSKKEELFDLANSDKLKNYIGKDALEFIDDAVQVCLDMPYDYLPEEEITNLAKEAGISKEEYINTIFKDAIYTMEIFDIGFTCWCQYKEYAELLTLYKDYIAFLRTL